eukprot:scaffold269629_cov19-Prasinocladus_malaysianus.AAC.1
MQPGDMMITVRQDLPITTQSAPLETLIAVFPFQQTATIHRERLASDCVCLQVVASSNLSSSSTLCQAYTSRTHEPTESEAEQAWRGEGPAFNPGSCMLHSNATASLQRGPA